MRLIRITTWLAAAIGMIAVFQNCAGYKAPGTAALSSEDSNSISNPNPNVDSNSDSKSPSTSASPQPLNLPLPARLAQSVETSIANLDLPAGDASFQPFTSNCQFNRLAWTPGYKLQALLPALSSAFGDEGEGGLSGIGAKLSGLLDRDGDGSPLNDITGFAKGLFGKS